MQSVVQVLSNALPRKSKEGEIFGYEAQVIILGSQLEVGVLMIFHKLAEECGILREIVIDGQKMSVVPPGAYSLEYGLSVGWKDRKVTGSLKSIKYQGAGNGSLAALNPAPSSSAASAAASSVSKG